MALVAESAAQLVGLAWIRLDPRDPLGTQLYQMWVDPRYRCLGVGRGLLGAAMAWAAGIDARYLMLSVTCGDTAARRLYERAGFESVGDPEPLRPGSSQSAQPMRLLLRPGERGAAGDSRRTRRTGAG